MVCTSASIAEWMRLPDSFPFKVDDRVLVLFRALSAFIIHVSVSDSLHV
jgi:hypothetical protein